MKYHEKTSLIFLWYLFQWAYNTRVDELLLSSEHIEETFHYLDRKATNQVDTLMEYVWREWIRNRTKTYKMAIFRVIFGACSKWQPTGDLMFNDDSKSPASTPTGLSGYVEPTRKPWGGGNIRKISFSSRIYHVPHHLFTWPVPTQTEELPPASSFANYLVPAVFDLGAMHLLMVDSLSLSRSSGGRCLREDAMHITSLCGQFIKFPTGTAANEAKQALSSVAVRYHLNTIYMKMHEKWFSKRQFTCNYL